MSVGHYWAIAKRVDIWWRFNDEMVERAPHGPELFCNLKGVIVTTLVLLLAEFDTIPWLVARN